MNDVMGIALGGMRAAHQGVQVAAHNVANLATPDARRLQLLRSEAEQGGVQAAMRPLPTPMLARHWGTCWRRKPRWWPSPPMPR